MGDKLIMSERERLRKSIFDRVKDGTITQMAASKRLGLCYRQTKRAYQRYLKLGDKGLVHQSRGRRSSRAFSEDFKDKVLSLYQDKYKDFGPTLATEYLAEEDNYHLSAETLRGWLIADGLWRRRKRKVQRQRRPRRTRFGELLQLDGSIHGWLPGDASQQCLMNMVDDATGKTLAILSEGETTRAAFELLRWWIELHGIPQAIYVDLKTVYVSPKTLKQSNIELEEYQSSMWHTQFSRACEKLGIAVIKAYSPQAKGRVERNHAVYQDRFVKALKLKNITTIAEANKLLRRSFISKLNQKFAKLPSSLEDAHVPASFDKNWQRHLCWEYTRTIRNDWTVSFEGNCYQLKDKWLRPKQKIVIRRYLNGELAMFRENQKLNYHQLADRPATETKKSKGHDVVAKSKNATANRNKTPWGRFNPSWLTKTNPATLTEPTE